MLFYLGIPHVNYTRISDTFWFDFDVHLSNAFSLFEGGFVCVCYILVFRVVLFGLSVSRSFVVGSDFVYPYALQ